MFKFSASDVQGASNIFRIQGVFSVGGNDTDGTGGPVGTPTAPDNGLCNFLYDAPTNLVYMGDATGSGWTGSSVVGSNGIDLYSPSGACIIHAATSTSWVSNTGPQPVPKAYVADLILDVTLPATQANKYHIYSFVENGDSNFDGCGFYVIGRCPVWRYSGYWWNVQ